jgi:putative pyruvate formate lyase activating enzyme
MMHPAVAHRPAYLRLPDGELHRRAAEAVAALADCRLCPRDCGVDRLAGKWSACKTGRFAVVSSAFAHHGEESCLRGWRGSGTIFFGHCNLRCVFCQNADISQGMRPGPSEPGMAPHRLARLMVSLQEHGVHNINWVTPEHVVPQLLEALVPAVEAGLTLPIVYNTSAYDSPRALAWMDGVVDIYMPDLKTLSTTAARRLLKAADYPEAATAAIREMHRQVGDLEVDGSGLARRGLLIRHLVMPGMLADTQAVLEWIAAELGPGTYVNLMDQYRPAGRY